MSASRSVVSLRRCFAVAEKCGNLVPALEKLIGIDQVKSSSSVRAQYSHDEGHFPPQLPDVVVCPKSVEQVSAILRMCNEAKVPVIPYGTGTGLEGGVIPVQGGICMDLKGMSDVVEVNETDFDCTVQPGVTRKELNRQLRATGLWFTVDPGADASICGMVATGATGTTSVRYGTMKSNVKNLEVVLADGTIIHTRGEGRRPWKSSAGYNITELFVGSEGTLGVITAATVKLNARPPSLSAAVCAFPDVASAIETVVNIQQLALPVARIEFLDDRQVVACNHYCKLHMEEKPTLFFDFHGASELEVQNQAKSAEEICKSNGGSAFEWSTDSEGIDRLWAARHKAYYATMAHRADAHGFTTDVCVPISALPSVLTETRVDMDASGLYGTIVGHVGEGNFHCIFPVYEDDKQEMEVMWNLSEKIVKRALAVGGTCTGEHGVGIGKIRFLREEFGDPTLNLMKTLKRTLDPNGILNPGKMFDMST